MSEAGFQFTDDAVPRAYEEVLVPRLFEPWALVLLGECNLRQTEKDQFRGKLRIGLHRDVEVTDAARPLPVVSQAFCSALPVAYGEVPARHWGASAKLVLEAAYEATLWATVLNAQRGGSRSVLLTSLGERSETTRAGSRPP